MNALKIIINNDFANRLFVSVTHGLNLSPRDIGFFIEAAIGRQRYEQIGEQIGN